MLGADCLSLEGHRTAWNRCVSACFFQTRAVVQSSSIVCSISNLVNWNTAISNKIKEKTEGV